MFSYMMKFNSRYVKSQTYFDVNVCRSELDVRIEVDCGGEQYVRECCLLWSSYPCFYHRPLICVNQNQTKTVHRWCWCWCWCWWRFGVEHCSNRFANSSRSPAHPETTARPVARAIAPTHASTSIACLAAVSLACPQPARAGQSVNPSIPAGEEQHLIAVGCARGRKTWLH